MFTGTAGRTAGRAMEKVAKAKTRALVYCILAVLVYDLLVIVEMKIKRV